MQIRLVFEGTVSSDGTCSVKAVDQWNKKEEFEEWEEEDGETGIFYNTSKILQLGPFILIIDGTSKKY